MSGDVPPPPAANPLLLGHATEEAVWLRALRSGRLPHAWLILGPRGVGKATLAYRLARRLLAGDRGAGEPPGPESAVFRMVAHRSHPDLHVLAPDREASRKLRPEIRVEAARDALEPLYATSAFGGARVLLVDAADELNRSAANALLKLLEEPPPALVLLLICQRPGLVPATIASRCAKLRLRPLPRDLVLEGLRRLAPALAEERRARLAELAGGSIGRALELEALGWPEAYAELVQAIEAGATGDGDALAVAEKLAELGRQHGFPHAVALLAELVHRAARVAAGAVPAVELVPEEAPRLRGLGLGLDRWTRLWEKLAAAAGQAEALNLDPLQTFLGLVHGIAPSSPVGLAGRRP
jgi:DNA polymerase-3 subunit delta'